jgi:PAS domain S-box-containing protein
MEKPKQPFWDKPGLILKLELGFAIISILQIITLMGVPHENYYFRLITFITPLICLIGAASYYMAYRMSANFTRHAALPWLTISFAVLILAGGDFVNLFLGISKNPWLLEGALFRSVFLMGVLQFPRTKISRSEIFQRLAGFSLVCLVVGLIYWTYFINPLLARRELVTSQVIFSSLLYPLLNISIFWILGLLPAFNFQKGSHVSPKIYLIIGFSLYFGSNAIASSALLFENNIPENIFYFNLMVITLLGLAGFEQARLISLQIQESQELLPPALSNIDSAERQTETSTTKSSITANNANLILAYTILNPHLRDIIIYVRVSDGLIMAANQAAELEYGYTAEEMLHLTINDLRSPETLGALTAQMQQANQEGLLFYTTHRRKDGSAFPVEVRSVAGEYLDHNCNISIIRDISEREKSSETLRAAYYQFERTFASLEDLILVQSPEDGKIIMANEASQRMLGYYPIELMGREPDLLFAFRDDLDYIGQEFDASIKATGKFQIDVRMQTRDGEILLAEVTIVEILDDSKRRIGIVSIFHDITERRKAEIRTFKSESRYKALFDNIKEGIVLLEYKIIDRNYPRLYFLEANPTFFQQLNITREQAEGQELNNILPGDVLDWAELGQKVVITGQSLFFQQSYSPLDKIFLISAFSLESGTMALLLMDITEQRTVERKLQESVVRQQALSRRLINVQEEERRHLGRELHDEIGQVLTGLKFTIEAGLGMNSKNGNDLSGFSKNNALAAVKIINDLIVQVRELSRKLRPTMLDDFGLVPALTSLCDRMGQFSELEIKFEHPDLDLRLPSEIETGAYRIVQEALTNIIRHAAARQAWIKIRLETERLIITIEDNGQGFVVAETMAVTKSMGLSGIFERASLLKGSLTVDSSPGLGTRISVWLPLEKTRLEEVK